jgi:hypothetical protein
MSSLWAWLSDGNNQRTVGFVGGGMAAAAGLAWQVYVYLAEHRASDEPQQQEAAALLAPVPLTPRCDSVIAWPGETIPLIYDWRPVAGASSYTVEVDCFGCGQAGQWYSSAGIPWHVRTGLGFRTQQNPIYSSSVHVDWRAAGGTGLRWRVWAVDEADRAGAKSPWCPFSFSGDIR